LWSYVFISDLDENTPAKSRTARWPYIRNGGGGDQSAIDQWNSEQDSLTTDQLKQTILASWNVYVKQGGVETQFRNAVTAATYADFVYLDDRTPGTNALEAPHDTMHVCIGNGDSNTSRPDNALGDMSVPDYAGWDPIFYLHHCWVDYIFEQWWQGGKNQIPFDSFDNGLPFPDNLLADRAGQPYVATDPNLPTNWGIQYAPADSILGTSATVPPVPLAASTLKFRAMGIGRLGAQMKSPQPVHATGASLLVKVDRSNIRGSFIILVKDKASGKLETSRVVFNALKPQACPACSTTPVLAFHIPIHKTDAERKVTVERLLDHKDISDRLVSVERKL